MSYYMFLMIMLIIGAGIFGYQAASNDLLQQIIVSRKLSHRLSQLLCVALILAVLWVRSPLKELMVVPVIAILGYAAIYAILRFGFRKQLKASKSELLNEFREAVLRTIICVLTMVGGALLICLLLACFPARVAWLGVVREDIYLCHGILMAAGTVLLLALGHYLIVLWLYPNENETPSRSLLQLRKSLRSLPPV